MAAVIAATLYLSFLLQAVVGGALLLIATFCLAFSVYNLNKVSDLKEDLVNQPNRAQFVKKYRDYIVFACLESVNIAVILAFFTNPAAILVILFPFYVGLFYSMGIRRKRIKDVFVLKNIMIAAAITLGPSLLPLAIHVANPHVVLLVAYWFFLKVFTHSVVLDVRDIDGDRKAGVHTIPVSLGRNKTRNLLLFLNSTLILWLVFSLYQGLFYPYLFALILSVLYGYWFILRFTRSPKATGLFELFISGEWLILALYAMPFALGWPHIL